MAQQISHSCAETWISLPLGQCSFWQAHLMIRGEELKRWGWRRMTFFLSKLSASFYNAMLSAAAAFEDWGFHSAYTIWTKSKTKPQRHILTAASYCEHPLTLSRRERQKKRNQPQTLSRDKSLGYNCFFFSLLESPRQQETRELGPILPSLVDSVGTGTSPCLLS